MGKPGYIAVAILLASLVGACGAEDQTTQSRQPNTYTTATVRPPNPQSDMGPPPHDMPGGGRGSDPPHFKGKP
jgi:hypothetical protein